MLTKEGEMNSGIFVKYQLYPLDHFPIAERVRKVDTEI